MGAWTCTEIYDASAGTNLATSILSSSQACGISEFPSVCDYPCGKIALCKQNLSDAASCAHRQHLKSATYNSMKNTSSKLI